jgi:hypothetical protein
MAENEEDVSKPMLDNFSSDRGQSESISQQNAVPGKRQVRYQVGDEP